MADDEADADGDGDLGEGEVAEDEWIVSRVRMRVSSGASFVGDKSSMRSARRNQRGSVPLAPTSHSPSTSTTFLSLNPFSSSPSLA
jgi:hypothetical protein